MQLERRPATEADIPFLLSLRRETMDGHLVASGAGISDEAHHARVLHHFDCAEVLTHDGNAVGLLKVDRQAGVWSIVQIQLGSQLQGQGIGRALLEGVIAEAAAAGAGVTLGVLKANPARKLYESLGFAITGEDAHEYQMHRAG